MRTGALTPAEIERVLTVARAATALAGGALPESTVEVTRQRLRGELTSDEAIARILANQGMRLP